MFDSMLRKGAQLEELEKAINEDIVFYNTRRLQAKLKGLDPRAILHQFRHDGKCDHNGTYEFGIILSGHGRAIKWDSSGRLIIISLLKAGSEIGVILAASLDHKSPAAVQAQEDVLVLQRSRLNGFWPGAKGDVPGMTGCCATI